MGLYRLENTVQKCVTFALAYLVWMVCTAVKMDAMTNRVDANHVQYVVKDVHIGFFMNAKATHFQMVYGLDLIVLSVTCKCGGGSTDTCKHN